MVLWKFPWAPGIGNSRRPIHSKAIEELTLKYSLMSLSNLSPISLLTMSMLLRPSRCPKSLLFVIEWRKRQAAICSTHFMLDRRKFGIINCSILTMKLSLCWMFSVVELWRSAEWRFFKRRNWESWTTVNNNWGFTNARKIRKLRTCMTLSRS